MSFNRSLYDPCATELQVQDNNKLLSYSLNVVKNSACRVEQGIVGGLTVKSDKNLVDVESELRNQTRPYSRCPQDKYVPKCTGLFARRCGKHGLPCSGCMPKNRVLSNCNLVNPPARIQNVGYTLQFPSCPANNPASLSTK
jgi:hypothetical protein